MCSPKRIGINLVSLRPAVIWFLLFGAYLYFGAFIELGSTLWTTTI